MLTICLSVFPLLFIGNVVKRIIPDLKGYIANVNIITLPNCVWLTVTIPLSMAPKPPPGYHK